MFRRIAIGIVMIGFLIVLSGVLISTSSSITVVNFMRSTDAASEQVFREIDGTALAVPHPGVFTYDADTTLGKKHSFLDGVRPRSFVAYARETATGTAPVILLLHGAGRDAYSMIEMWKDTADVHGLLLLALNAKQSGWALDDAGTLIEMLSQAEQHYTFDQTRVFLFGHSAGAILSQVLSNRVKGPWRATATHGGYATPNSLIPIERGVPVRAYLGTSDHIFSPVAARRTAERFAESGHPSELVLIPNHTHWFYEIGPAIAQDAWRWFETISS